MTLESITHILPAEHLDSVLRFWPSLIVSEKQKLVEQVEAINLERLRQQKKLLKKNPFKLEIEPFTDYTFKGNTADREDGFQLIQKGKVGCIILAGGQGTRLGFEGPKGLFPTSVIQHKSLYQLCFEKVLAAGKQAGRDLYIAVMTSPENDAITKEFLTRQHFFNLNENQVSFYSQDNLPFLDEEGRLFLESTYKISQGPDGNGQCLHNFVKSGLWDHWKKLGIEYINIILIDNPLADPFDAELVGFHVKRNVDVTIKCIEKTDPDEKVGVLVKEGSHCCVVEYSELPEEEKQAKIKTHLKHCCANISLFCFSMDFTKKVVTKHPDLPLHKAWKSAKFVNATGITQTSPAPIAWKFENFVFDLLHYTNRTAALLYPRNQCFAPLKNYTGAGSISEVQEALQNRDKDILEAITGLPAPAAPFELAADFYYPTPQLLAHWKGRQPITPYVEE